MLLRTESGYIFGSKDPDRTLRTVLEVYLEVKPTARAMRKWARVIRTHGSLCTGMTTLTLVRQ